MDTVLQILRLRSLPALILRRNSSTWSRADPEIDEEHVRYTSLKDIILNSPQHSATVQDQESSSYDFDPSNITIRNQLVKRAASYYVQSATILAGSRDQNILVSFWGRLMRGHCVGLSIEGCLRLIWQFFACVVGNVRSTCIE